LFRLRLLVKATPSLARHASVAWLMNSEPLSPWNSETGSGTEALTPESSWKTHLWALFSVARGSTQPENTSVAVRVCRYWSLVACPQWWTVSICLKPGFPRSSGA